MRKRETYSGLNETVICEEEFSYKVGWTIKITSNTYFTRILSAHVDQSERIMLNRKGKHQIVARPLG